MYVLITYNIVNTNTSPPPSERGYRSVRNNNNSKKNPRAFSSTSAAHIHQRAATSESKQLYESLLAQLQGIQERNLNFEDEFHEKLEVAQYVNDLLKQQLEEATLALSTYQKALSLE